MSFIEALNNECIRLRQEIQALQKCCDEFKLRTCENCKHGDYRPDGGNTDAMETYCSELRLITNQDFGCNQWKERINK